MEEIDPVKYGVLWERVQQMDKKIDKMERQIEELLALANRNVLGCNLFNRQAALGSRHDDGYTAIVVWVDDALVHGWSFNGKLQRL